MIEVECISMLYNIHINNTNMTEQHYNVDTHNCNGIQNDTHDSANEEQYKSSGHVLITQIPPKKVNTMIFKTVNLKFRFHKWTVEQTVD